jgi:N-acetylmuramic acid 6-phosphate etherase
MAVAGSTRMQATSSELLVVGAAMEMALSRLLQRCLPAQMLSDLQCDPSQSVDYAGCMARLINQLGEPTALAALGRFTQFEQEVYEHKGLVTYAATDYLLDVLTDTTERAPTFRLPPYRKCDDDTSARSWAFVKNPLGSTRDTWRELLRRSPRGLDWTAETYRRLEAPAVIQSNPPVLDNQQIYLFQVGNEPDRSRFETDDSAWVMIAVGEEARAFSAADHPFRQEFDRRAVDFQRTAAVCVGPDAMDCHAGDVVHVPVDLPPSPIRLWHHLAIKLVLNTVSTATMTRMGRVLGNWMVYVETSNKKLVDRGTRLVAELAGLSYEEASFRLHETMKEVEPRQRLTRDAPSPVALALERLGVTAPDGPIQ